MRSSLSETGAVPDLAPGLMRLASRLAGRSDAEDLVQSTWLRAMEHHGTPVDAPRSWLRQVLVNEQRMQLRGRLRRDSRERAVGQTQADPVDVDDVVHCLEVARVVRELLDELDDDVRLVVRERYLGGDSAAEIARRHRIPAGTVRWRLKSGLDRLREQLDTRYGGRRALWAGGLVPTSVAPTLSKTAASQTPTVPQAWASTAKGPSAMSIKITLAAGLMATAGGVAWVASGEPDPTTPATTEVAAVTFGSARTPTESAAEVVATPEPGAQAKARWAAQRSLIRAARARTPAAAAAPADDEMTWHAEGHGEIELPPHGEHQWCSSGDDCLGGFAREVAGLIDGCKEFMTDVEPAMTLTAHVIGAPDVGSIVESVELSSGEGAPEDLRECLTETMYTLDLGPTEHSFERDVTVMLGGASTGIDALVGADLDEETLAAVEQALAEHGKSGEDRVAFIAVDR